MNPNSGEFVSIVFRNGSRIDGEVVSWTSSKSVLKSTTGSIKIVIQKTDEDILFFKINNVKEDFQKLKEKPYKENEDLKSIAELQSELKQIERDEIAEKLSSHEASSSYQFQPVKYGLPFQALKSPPKQQNASISTIEHSRTQIPRENFGFDTELQNLFSKKNNQD